MLTPRCTKRPEPGGISTTHQSYPKRRLPVTKDHTKQTRSQALAGEIEHACIGACGQTFGTSCESITHP